MALAWRFNGAPKLKSVCVVPGLPHAIAFLWCLDCLLLFGADACCSCAALVQLRITEGELNTGLGTQQKEFDITRKIQIVYLDDTLRIARWAAAWEGQTAGGC